MNDYILDIKKNPHRQGDHLAFFIYSGADVTYRGAHYNQKIEEHYEKLMWGEENKTGSYINLFDTAETDHEIYYLINCNSTSEITAIAETIIQENPENYVEQRRNFITFLTEQNVILRQL
ncbi:hypothetical protein ACWGKR_24420 [Bacillus thuringiensis]|uniref:hypothetical protein n=1 Tax=Bacillus thuringiensis TaxID=1428 RepID=UPI0021D6591B|nr:hypothetical protein [Bacillus thuringiensis]MCU7679302.1 hypothetical protein [Bacillus thuringiensis]